MRLPLFIRGAAKGGPTATRQGEIRPSALVCVPFVGRMRRLPAGSISSDCGFDDFEAALDDGSGRDFWVCQTRTYRDAAGRPVEESACDRALGG